LLDDRKFPLFASGDFDGDGHADIVAVQPGGTTIQVARGLGNCTFWDRHVYQGPTNVSQLLVDDVDGDGLDDLVLVGDEMMVMTTPLRIQGATQVVVRNEPMCEGQTIDATTVFGSEATWDIERDELCRIGRLDVEYTTVAASDLRGPLFKLQTHSDTHSLLTEGAPNGDVGLLSPENTATLKKLQGYPLFDGRWILDASAELAGARLLINAPPQDPFDAENPYPFCAAGIDQNDEGNCILEDSVVANTSQIGDIDTFIIAGPLRGAFLADRQITVTMTAPGAAQMAAEVAIYPMGAAQFESQVLIAAPGAPASYSIVVPAEFNGRYFVVKVIGVNVDAFGFIGGDYGISFVEGPVEP
jgi:hypothetical protein